MGKLFTKGHKINLGRHPSKKTIEKIRTLILKRNLKKRKELGYVNSPETRKKMSLAKKGKKWSQEARRHHLLSVHKNENHHNWKGNRAGYYALHIWVKIRLGKAKKCSNNINHKSTRFNWANISGEYKRDLSDWHELCHKCNRNDGVKIHKRFLKKL